MSVNASNVLAGAGSCYYATFGTAFPGDSTATVSGGPPSGFTDFGGTQGGLTVEVDQTIKDKVVDQVLLPVGGYPTKEAITLKTKLAEATLNNLATVMNGKFTVTPNSGYTTADWATTTTSEQLSYISLIFDGWAPTLSSGSPARRRVCAYKVLSEGKVGATYKVDDQVFYEVTFHVYFVSASQTPIHWIDQTA